MSAAHSSSQPSPTVSFVVAVTANGVIGRENAMPWRLSTDLRRFKALTLGRPTVMGRKTWESLPFRPLPGRANIVITRDPAYEAEGAEVVASLEEALSRAASAPGGDEICVIGGGEIFTQALQRADRLYVTHIEADIDGDTLFPRIDPLIWYVADEETVPMGEKDEFPTRYVVYERRENRP